MSEQLTVENYDALRNVTPAYKWYGWDLESGDVAEVPGEPFAALPSVNTVNGRRFFGDQRSASDDGGLGVVPFYELTASGIEPAFVGYGTTWNILRIR